MLNFSFFPIKNYGGLVYLPVEDGGQVYLPVKDGGLVVVYLPVEDGGLVYLPVEDGGCVSRAGISTCRGWRMCE